MQAVGCHRTRPVHAAPQRRYPVPCARQRHAFKSPQNRPRGHAGRNSGRRRRVGPVASLNEGSSDADVRREQNAGDPEPGVLDKVATVVRGAAARVAASLTKAGNPDAAAQLMPSVSSSASAEDSTAGGGSSADLGLPPAAAAAAPVAADRSDDGTAAAAATAAADGSRDEAATGSQEWLAPQPKLPDQAPAEVAPSGGGGQPLPEAPARQQLTDAQERELDAAVSQLPEAKRDVVKAALRSSWGAKDARGGDKDYLYELGNTDYNTNVDTGQGVNFGLDSLFHGNSAFGLGTKSDIADGSLRGFEFRKFDNIQGDYYISPAFLEAVTMHIVKNFLWESLHGAKLPVILGIWGPKGCGKSFQTELAFRKLGVEPIIMSAGELEHEWAGTPGRLIRDRYRRASELSRVRGRLSCLLINDLDAGVGHFANTQVTVNNQNVVGTLMNICDDPTRVSGGGSWREQDVLRRIPIIVTGNDFSTLFAPLIRDGRMEKFYWEPTRGDLLEILQQMYKEDGVTVEELGQLLDAFPGQPLDFFGAIRAGTYDNQIRTWLKDDVVKGELSAEGVDAKELGRRLLSKTGLPVFDTDHITLEVLMAEGRRIREEQEAVGRMRLSAEYMSDGKNKRGGRSIIGLTG